MTEERVGEEVKVRLRGRDGHGSIGERIRFLFSVAIIHMHMNIMQAYLLSI